MEKVRELYMQFVNGVPDYILQNMAELVGTLLASVVIAVITTYIFNRNQEIQKVKGRVMQLRLDMYDQIINLLKKYDRRISWENDREQLLAGLEMADIHWNGRDTIVAFILSDYANHRTYLQSLDQLCVKGIYILDDDTLQSLLSLKIYFLNYQMFSELLDGYELRSGGRVDKQTREKVKELFYEYYSIVCAGEYEEVVRKVESTIHQKRTQLRFERHGKNYRKLGKRKKLQDALWKDSKFAKSLPNALILMGIILCQELQYEDDEVEMEMNHWAKYLEHIMMFKMR